jgi:para-nitrobenzyl esterase
MASPLARGLFHRAIAQSGGLMAPLGKPGSGSMLIRADAEKLGSRYATHLGVHSIAEMRALPAESVQLSWPQALGRSPVTSLDGWFLDQEIHEAYRAGRQASVPLISGATANEGATLPALASDTTLGRALDHKYGACAQAMLDCYGEAGDASDLYRTIRGHVTFNWQNWSQAREHAPSHGAPVYAYYFDRAPPLPAGLACFENAADKLGAFHTSEIPYVFGSLAARPWNWRPADHHLSVAMGAYWINFARTGDPNGPGLPGWPRFDTETAQVQRFAETITSGPHPLRHEMMTWDSCMARLRGGR